MLILSGSSAESAAVAAPPTDEELLEALELSAFRYFLEVFNPANGLVADTTRSGSPCSIRIAVDAEGKVIEEIAVDGSGEVSLACMKAIGKWQFSPILEEGKPRPYRGEISFRVPR